MIKGLIAPILTPFNNDLTLNQDLYNELAKNLLDNGCSGLAPFGTTGEALSVGNQERMIALEKLIESGIDPNVLIPGTGLCNLPDTILLSQHAMNLGCRGVMTLPPFYIKDMNDQGLFEHYEKLIEGINGLFVGFPSQKGNDDEYRDTVWAERELKDELAQMAIKEYGQEVMAPPAGMEEADFLPPTPSEKEEVPAVAVPFSDDDIPF